MSLHTITGTSPATATTAVLGSAVGMLQQYDGLRIVASLIGATGGTLDVYLQTSVDGTTWYDYAHYAQLAAAAGAATLAFTVTRSAQQASITAIGSNASPALAANSVIGGDFGDRMRAICVAGAGTSVGALTTINITGVHRRV